MREAELQAFAKRLSLCDGAIKVIRNEHIRDGPEEKWNRTLASELLLNHIRQIKPDEVLSPFIRFH